MFCKLFGTPEDQILVMLREGEEGPEIRVYYNLGGIFGICETGLGFATEKKAKKAFDDFTEEAAKKIVDAMKKMTEEF